MQVTRVWNRGSPHPKPVPNGYLTGNVPHVGLQVWEVVKVDEMIMMMEVVTSLVAKESRMFGLCDILAPKNLSIEMGDGGIGLYIKSK